MKKRHYSFFHFFRGVSFSFLTRQHCSEKMEEAMMLFFGQ